MSYPVTCNRCGDTNTAWEIVDLIKNHTDGHGNLICQICGGDAYVYRESTTQDGGTWERYIRGAVPFRTQFGRRFVPYIFLVSYSPRGKPKDVHFNYYKDLRPDGGTLKHGHGPGGAPVFGKAQILKLLEHALSHQVLSRKDLVAVVSSG